MYQVGFGDCFLLSFRYGRPLRDGRAERQVLVDFGSTHAPARQRLDMAAVAEKIAQDCGGKLDVVVVTHRHRDHLSGFANNQAAATLEALDPTLIVQPWTEDPAAPALATGPIGVSSRQLLRGLDTGQAFAEQLARTLSAAARGLPDHIRELAEEQLKNAEAVTRLQQWAAARDGEYLFAGEATKIEHVVPGVSVEVLGPPTVDQYPDVVNGRARDPEYWMLYQGILTAGLSTGVGLHDDEDDREPAVENDDDEPDVESTVAALRLPPGPARWLASRLQRQQLHSLQRIVRTLDDALNNTSLILLFQVGTKRLLFPGDAQIEDWRYTLDGLPRNKRLQRRLRELDLYKVGHHGSRNASPRSLLNLWDGTADLMALMSTRAGVHGKTEATAVPRATLVTALEERATLRSSETLPAGGSVLVEAEATTSEPFR
jgi:hypothetical protein